MQKDNTNRYWIISGLYAFLEKGGNFLFSFGSVLILYRSLPESEMGIWILFLTVCALLEVTRMGLVQNALVKFLSAEKETEHGLINTASLFLNIALTVSFSGLLYLCAPVCADIWESPSIIPLLHVYVLTTLVLTPMYQSNFILQANLSFRGIFLSNTIRQGSFFLFLLYLYVTNASIELLQLAQFQVFTAFMGSLTAVYYAKPYLHFVKQVDWQWVKKLVDFGKYALSTNLSFMLYK
ncbi:MAG: oligosaccharide flippase family protein, partial [Bacteroidota bacterium]